MDFVPHYAVGNLCIVRSTRMVTGWSLKKAAGPLCSKSRTLMPANVIGHKVLIRCGEWTDFQRASGV